MCIYVSYEISLKDWFCFKKPRFLTYSAPRKAEEPSAEAAERNQFLEECKYPQRQALIGEKENQWTTQENYPSQTVGLRWVVFIVLPRDVEETSV